jgi:hypothetical protein
MNPILSVLGSGITARKILEFLMRKSPELAPKITQALASGLSAEKIMKFFSKDQNYEKLRSEMESQYPTQNNANPLIQAQNIRSQNLGSDMASGLQRNAMPILGSAAALGTSYALSRAIPSILQQGQPKPSLTTPTNPQTTQAQNQTQTPIIQSQQPPSSNVQPNIAQTVQPVQPEVKTLPAEEILNNFGIKERVDALLKNNDSVTTAKAVWSLLTPIQKKTYENAFKNKEVKQIKDVIEEYSESIKSSQTKEQPPIQAESKAALHSPITENLPKSTELVQKKASEEEEFPKGWGPFGKEFEDKLNNLIDDPNTPEELRKNLIKERESHEEFKKNRPKKEDYVEPVGKFKKPKVKNAELEKKVAIEERKNKDKLKKELESLKGMDISELDQMTNEGLKKAAKEYIKGRKEGIRYFTHTGGEFKAIGHKDITEQGKEEHQKAKGKGEDEHLIRLIEKYLPVGALYKRYKAMDKKLTTGKFFSNIEKGLIDLVESEYLY